MPFQRQRAYRIAAAPIPVSRSTWLRWEELGLITLARVAGKTLVTDETIDAVLEGKVAIPPHPRRKGHGQIQPKSRPGRPRKAVAASPQAAPAGERPLALAE
jgi:hypothetical protein